MNKEERAEISMILDSYREARNNLRKMVDASLRLELEDYQINSRVVQNTMELLHSKMSR